MIARRTDGNPRSSERRRRARRAANASDAIRRTEDGPVLCRKSEPIIGDVSSTLSRPIEQR
jgi:hypothetical protein